jgi:hypothetical protein
VFSVMKHQLLCLLNCRCQFLKKLPQPHTFIF